MKNKIFLFLLLSTSFTSYLTCLGQAADPEPLFRKLRAGTEDTNRVNTYYTISRYYWNKNADSVLLMGQRGLQLATTLRFEKGMALSYLTMGVAYGTKGLYPQALDCHLKALRLSENLGMEGLVGNDYTNIAIIYSNMRNFPKALEYFQRSLQIARKFPDQRGIAIGYLNIGDLYSQTMNLDSAVRYTVQAIRITEAIKDSPTLSTALANLGDIYNRKSQPATALPYFQRALLISGIIHDPDGVAYVYGCMAESYHQLGQYQKSIGYATNSLHGARQLQATDAIKTAYHSLYTDYLSLKDYLQALQYRNLEIGLNDSLYTLEKEKQIKRLQTDYELDSKQHQLDLLQKEGLVRQAELQRARTRSYIIVSGALLLSILAFFLIRSNREKRRNNRLLATNNQELADLNEVKNKLLSIISHDLRSPIATLKGFLELLNRAGIPPEKTTYFTVQLGESLTQTSTLLDNLLFWAKAQMNGLTTNPNSFNLVPLLDQNARLAAARAQKKNILLAAGATETPVMAFADALMIDMVIRNLVDNAIKFSGDGDTVRLSAAITQEGVMVSVSDTGKGIPVENKDKLFSSVSFTTTGTSMEKGSGLGLSLCKEMIEKNKGRIWFESIPGQGATFSFIIPGA